MICRLVYPSLQISAQLVELWHKWKSDAKLPTSAPDTSLLTEEVSIHHLWPELPSIAISILHRANMRIKQKQRKPG